MDKNQNHEHKTHILPPHAASLLERLLSAAIFVLTASACKPQENNEISLEFTEKNVEQAGETFSIGVVSTDDWTITAETPEIWCTATKSSSTTATIEVSANGDFSDRTVVYEFRCGKATAKLTIIQSQYDELIVSQAKFKIGPEGGEIKIPILTNVEYQAEVVGNTSEWISIANLRTKAIEKCFIVLEIAEYTGEGSRTGDVNVFCAGKRSTVTITQYVNAIYYTSSDGKIVKPNKTNVFGANIVSNTYENGIGKISFNRPVTSIGSGAFGLCSSLTSVIIPDSVTSIGSVAFYDCSGLTSVTIPDSVTSIGSMAFELCSSLTSVIIPDSVTSIGDDAFSACSGLTSVTIPDSVTSIGSGAFSYCSGLESFYGKYASDANRCLIIDGTLVAFAPKGLTSYEIPNSVTSIGNKVFYYYSSLTSVTIPNSVISIGKDAFSACSGLTSVTIPDSVTSIGSGAFSYCSGLESFYGKYASDANRCLIIDGTLVAFAPKGLTSYEIPNSVTSIGNKVFYYCSSLTSVTIPNIVTSIEFSAFNGCTKLTSIYCQPEMPPTLGMFAFESTNSSLKIYVPTASVTSYKNAYNWSSYSSRIVGYDF